MKLWLTDYLLCPRTKKALSVTEITHQEGDEVMGGMLSGPGGISYPIRNGVARFVTEHYAAGFGYQWNRYAQTQIDSVRHRHSEERFWGETGFTPEKLRGKVVVDGGCGAGRFMDVAARAGAKVVGLDLSEAVDACFANNRHMDVCVVQGSLLNPPFKPEVFDFGFTIGVIQHTPDPLLALRELSKTVKVGGEMGVSWYKRYWYTYLHQKYWLRPFFKRMDEKKLHRFVSWYVPKLLPVSRFFAHFVPDGEILDRVFPVANRDNIGGLSRKDQLEWSILDTYDWYQPQYDRPQSWRAVERAMASLGYTCKRAPLRRRGLHCIRTRRSL